MIIPPAPAPRARKPDHGPLRLAGVAAVLALTVAAGRDAQATDALQWYQHYERATAAVEAGDYAAALIDLAAALEGEARPHRQIRTYGNRFLNGYDPFFLAARCHLALGDLESAAVALEQADRAAVTTEAARDDVRRQLSAARRIRGDSVRAPPGNGTASRQTAPAPAAPAHDPTPADPVNLVPARSADPTSAVPSPPVPAGTSPATGSGSGGTSIEAAAGLTPAPVALTPEAATDTNTPPAITVTSTPAGAEVRLDGKLIGTTPLPNHLVSPGEHRLELVRGDSRWSEAVETRAGSVLRVEVALPASVAAEPAPDAAPSADTAGGSTVADPAPGAAGESPNAAASPSRWPALAGFVVLALLGALGLRGGLASRRLGRLPQARRLGPYVLEGELGRGGMAITYRGRRRGGGDAVAIKIPHHASGGAVDPSFDARFLREGQLGETLHHPNIVRILDVGTAPDPGTKRTLPYLVMELVPGDTLRAELDAAPQGLGVERALATTRAVAEALDYAHGKGVVHRDLKPENVMRLPDGSVKVMDFGVARVEGLPGLTTSEVFLGSPLYAAPESVEPRTVDHRTDLYALGIMLYEMLTGAPPFVHESVYRVLELHQHAPLPAPQRSLPPALWALVERLAAKTPQARPQTAQQLLVELDRLERRPSADAVPSSADACHA